jgi:hypothetical protein
MSVPGTFKNRPPRPLRDRSPHAVYIETDLLDAGAIFAQRYRMGECSIILAREPIGPGRTYRWHLSIAHPSRYPSWDEIKTARYSLDHLAGVTMAQLLPPVADESEWVNLHENCFHLHELSGGEM